MKDKIQAIDALRTVLGTMVIIPMFKSDPNNIGSKVLESAHQYPIIEGEDRVKIKNKLIELVESI